MSEISVCHPAEVFLISRLLYVGRESDAGTRNAVKDCVGLTND